MILSGDDSFAMAHETARFSLDRKTGSVIVSASDAEITMNTQPARRENPRAGRPPSMRPVLGRGTSALLAAALAALLAPAPAAAQEASATSDAIIVGVKLRVGGRFDNVRMCVASPPGAKGGLAADISFFTELAADDETTVEIDVPVMRPILFGAAFRMLQFEPSVIVKFRRESEGRVEFVGGPVLGLSLHYGPDYESDSKGEDRGPSFFALGPTVGGYLGLDFKRPGETYNFQLGLTPYVTPLFGIDDPDHHFGVVVGGLLDGLFRFGVR